MPRPTGLVTVLLFVFLILAAYALDLRVNPLPVPIFVVLTILFITSGSVALAYVAALAYVRTGVVNMLLLGSGSLLFGSTSFVASLYAFMAGIKGSDDATSIFVLGAVVSAALHLSCVATRTGSKEDRRGSVTLATLSGVCAVLVAFGIILATSADVLPVFLVPGSGMTTVARIVLGVATAGFGIAAIIIAPSASRSGVLYWYCSALAVTAVGLAGLLLSDWVFTSIVFLLGRLALCLAGAYLVLSVRAAEKGAVPHEESVDELFRR